MKLSKAFQPLKFWSGGDKTNPRERYIYVDGSPYGSRHVGRFLMNPKFISSTAIGMSLYAAEAIFAPPQQRHAKLVYGAIILLSNYPILYALDWFLPSRQALKLRNTVIDKTGRAVSDPKDVIEVEKFLKRQIWHNVFIAPPVLLTIGLLAHLIPTVNIAYDAAEVLFAAYTRRKLQRKEWTVQSKPPELKKEVKVAAGKLAAVPVSSFVSRGLHPAP